MTKVTRNNIPLFNDLTAIGDAFADDLRAEKQRLAERYWELHDQIGKTSYATSSDQHVALEKLGQMALALRAYDEAYSAINRVRCW